ncbi:MAG: MerR family transcriptional regulator [Clostridiales bacterium]|jgi:predicted amidophosphoribosyltransferase|nr:MerR family transcriptional regulator [Clostridiales bacterium]
MAPDFRSRRAISLASHAKEGDFIFMEIVNCPRCGKVFAKIKSPYCPACQAEEEKTFQRLKEYVFEHPNCNISELSEGTQVNAKKILGYLREGRLETSNGMNGDIRCLSCNKPILSGRYCSSCKLDISKRVGELFPSKSDDSGARMYTAPKKTL